MSEQNEIINRVAQSGIITLDLEVLIPGKELAQVDIKDQLFQGLLLREKDFRAWVKKHDWSQYEEKYVAIYCSSDAIVPTWAYMLIAVAIESFTSDFAFCKPEAFSAIISERKLALIKPEDYKDSRVVIKGCGEREIDNHAFVKLTGMLIPHVKSLMFGEPCSTVPVYKKR